MKKSFKYMIIMLTLVFLVVLLYSNYSMAKYEILQTATVKVKFTLDKEAPIIELLDENGNAITNRYYNVTCNVILDNISDNLSGIMEATYRYSSNVSELSKQERIPVDVGMVFTDTGAYEIRVKDYANNTKVMKFYIWK